MANGSEPPKHRKSCNYPDPLIVPPAGEHKQTLIFLHGRGSSGSKFGPELLAAEIPNFENLVAAFPHAKFIFPTASKRRAAIYKRTAINQWFDNWSLDTPTERENLQIDGLRETSVYIHSLLREEISLIGARNVVLCGLSQGCAAALVSLLTWDGEPLATAVGMCGWLPFRKYLEDVVRDAESHTDSDDPFTHWEEEDDPFSREEDLCSRYGDSEAALRADPSVQTVAYLREELDMSVPSIPMPFQRIPLFLGHGTEDDKVYIHLGREAASCLTAMGIDVRWREYKGLGHWYSGDMLHDLVVFLCEKSGWEVEDGAVVSGTVEEQRR